MNYPEALFDALENQGWAVLDSLAPDGLPEQLYGECLQSWQAGLFHEAQIGHQHKKNPNAAIRGDSICWLDAQTAGPASHALFTWAQNLRHELNRRFFLGLNSEEFHFARYAPGRGYKKHLDQHQTGQHRKISLVLYLNRQWADSDGGELCLYAPQDEDTEVKRIAPQPDRLVIFRSDQIHHEVLPANQVRWSLAGWFRTDSAWP